MEKGLTDKDARDALDNCASEPVHIPGTVQAFGCLIGADAGSGTILYVSDNCREILGMQTADLMGAKLNALFGRDIAHALNNTAARSDFSDRSQRLGQFILNGRTLELSAFASNGMHVLQIEQHVQSFRDNDSALGTLSFLMKSVQSCPDTASLFKLTTELLRYFTGYDRVTIYRFDQNFNGAVIAESRQKSMDSLMGLRFPAWDIPSQARAIMQKVPLRFIQDVDQLPIRLRAHRSTMPPLDISLADCRGVSPVHLEYLRNMNVRGTMTLSIVVEETLWGIISFHHREPRLPTANQREILSALLDHFCTKLTALEKQAQVELVKKIGRMKDNVLREFGKEETPQETIDRIGPVIQEVLNADGVAFLSGSQTVTTGRTPAASVLTQLLDQSQSNLGTTLAFEDLSARYPASTDALNGCAGVLASGISDNRALCIFRVEAAQSVSWAGNPDKTIEKVSGKNRLAPRASFSEYIQTIEGRSNPWTVNDVYFAEHITEHVWALINNAERRELKNTLTRQQKLMINELNHRVRNILALVRSVSRQARRHYGSLESYSASLEKRIQALAAAHDIAAGSDVTAVDVKQLINVEMAPYSENGAVTVTGPSRFLRTDVVPIFSLIIHELATNAAKYGALSAQQGKVAISAQDVDGGVSVTWRESGGPSVTKPDFRGFGSTLIEQAVPHEMGGTAELRFTESGVEADFFLPNDILVSDEIGEVSFVEPLPIQKTDSRPPAPRKLEKFIIILEDNFVIAQDLKIQLQDMGYTDVEAFSNVADTLNAMESAKPDFAILDVNLGPGQTSEAVALRLQTDNVPFLFVTGYGANADLPEVFNAVPRLIKPVATTDLQNAMATQFELQSSN